jgi:hypothetical protein
MDPKTLPMIWGTHMKLVTKYQIFAINSVAMVFNNISVVYFIGGGNRSTRKESTYQPKVNDYGN